MTDEELKNGVDGGEKVSEEPETPIDFATFILSLSSTAAYHLGLAPHPEKETPHRNIPMAKQTIDILCILEEKTNGNLSESERSLLKEILYNLIFFFHNTYRLIDIHRWFTFTTTF